MPEREWKPGDGAEQTDSSREAAERRLGTGYWTAENRDEEERLGFDAAYTTWRQTHGDHHDENYRQWIRETGRPFSQAFLDWAETRPPKRYSKE